MERMGDETLSFLLLKSGKRQKVHLGRNVSTHFVADWSFSGGSKGGARGARPPPLFLDQIEARRAEKYIFFGDRGPPLSEGLDPLVNSLHVGDKSWMLGTG